jgi:HEAT repeat protein
MKKIIVLRSTVIVLFFSLVLGCNISVEKKEQLSEVDQLYNQGQYTNALNIARFNLSKNPKDPASIITVWKIQVIQSTKSFDFVQQFYFLAQPKVRESGSPLIPYLGKALLNDRQNAVRLFCLYCLSEFQDTVSTNYIIRIFEPNNTLGDKPGNITLEILRVEAATILAGRQHTPVFDHLVTLAGSQDQEIRARAVTAMGILGDKRAIPVLEKMTGDPYGQGSVRSVAEIADSALAKIKRR